MKITRVRIQNFRGYKKLTEIEIDDLTVFVGKNDVGKSTVLDALDIFFNNGKGTIKIDKMDINVQEAKEGNNESIITVCFKDLPEKIIIDSTVETALSDEYLLNSNGEFEVVKKYSNGGTAKTFINAYHPTNSLCADLLSKKNIELKKIVQNEKIECENQAINSVLRKAIWENFKTSLKLQEQEIDASKEDAKKIWDKLEQYLPIYSLFQADRKNNDGDSEVQDPLKEAVKQILTDEILQETLAKVAYEVEEKLKEVSKRTLDNLREMSPEVADSLNPIIPTGANLKWQDVFKNVSITGDDDIPINKRGSGVKRLILLNFFRAEAKRRSAEHNSSGVIYAVEEPETSQHSENQRLLIDAFMTLAKSEQTQIILTTHSSVIVKKLGFEEIRLIKENDDNTKEVINVLPGQLGHPSLNEVNYIAFNEVTEEYHDELYAFIEFQGWKGQFIEGKGTKTYIRKTKNGNLVNEEKILTEYIRHQIHHPENHNNYRYSMEELKTSIEEMRTFIEAVSVEQKVLEP